MKHIKPYTIFENIDTSKSDNITKKDIEEIIVKEDYIIEECIINDDLTIDALNVYMDHANLDDISLKFNHIKGYFLINDNFLESFKNSPNKIDGYFDCAYNHIKTLNYFPSYVGGEILIYGNPIHTLINTFIDKNNRNELINEFIHYQITDGEVVYIERLEMFCSDFNLEMPDLDKVKKHYKVI